VAGFLQTVVNGIINGSLIALLTLGFGLVFGTTGRFHWAMSMSLMFGALVTSILSTSGRLWFPIALVVGLLAAAIIGVSIELFAYRPLVARSVGPAFLAVFLTSLGIAIVGENVARMLVGSAGNAINVGAQSKTITLGAVSLSSFDAYSALIVWIVVALVWFTLNRTGLGRQIRAVQVNPLMSRVVGISPESVYVIVFAIGSVLAGISGVMAGIRVAVLPDMGTSPMLFAFVASFVAGRQSGVVRFAVAGLLIGLVQSICTNWLAIIWSPVVVFAILFAYVALRPVAQSPRFRSSRLGKWLNPSGRRIREA
jgi:branched-chain amino acid transport system permease protein